MRLNKLTLACLMATASFTTFAAEKTTPADQLRERLAETAAKGEVLFGHHDDPVYGHTWTGEFGRSDVREITGFYPGMMSWDLGHLELGKAVNLDGVNFDEIRRQARLQHERGGVNTFSWHLNHPLKNYDSWHTADSTAVATLVASEEGVAAYLAAIDRIADFFNSLTDEQGNRYGVIFRPWHEHTGRWFWWGAPHCSVEHYKALWHIMRKRFDERGVDNIVWAYSPDRSASEEIYMERYPGNEFVDIMGADVYHFNAEAGLEDYLTDANRTLAIACDMARANKKIAAFTETGLESLTMPHWYTKVLEPILTNYPISYVTVWRNAADKPEHFYTPYVGHPDAPDFKEFSNNPRIIFVK